MNKLQPAPAAVAAGAVGLGLSASPRRAIPKQELLAPQQPGVIERRATSRAPTGAEGLYNGAVGNFKPAASSVATTNQETIWQYTGLMTDVLRSSDTFSQRNDANQRVTQNERCRARTARTTRSSRSRGFSRTALQYLALYEPTTSERAPGGDVLHHRLRRNAARRGLLQWHSARADGQRCCAVHFAARDEGRVRRGTRPHRQRPDARRLGVRCRVDTSPQRAAGHEGAAFRSTSASSRPRRRPSPPYR